MIYRFANAVVDTDTVTIHVEGVPQACEPKAFALLQMLIENSARVVTKEEIIETLWDGRFITDGALTSCLNAARRAVGDDGRQQRIIRTVPKRGFRFVAGLDPLEPFAHMALAAVQLADGRPARALEALARAVELNPSFAWAHFHVGIVRLILGDVSGARGAVEHAIRLSPRDTLIGHFHAILSLCDFVARDYEGAIDRARRAITYPQPRWAHAYLLSSLGHLEDAAEVREIRTLISRVRPEFSLAYIEAHFPLLSGEPRERFLSGLRQAGLRVR